MRARNALVFSLKISLTRLLDSDYLELPIRSIYACVCVCVCLCVYIYYNTHAHNYIFKKSSKLFNEPLLSKLVLGVLGIQ